jgi:hypothetical protein
VVHGIREPPFADFRFGFLQIQNYLRFFILSCADLSVFWQYLLEHKLPLHKNNLTGSMKFQLAFFERLRALNPSSKTLPDDISQILGVSKDGVYRRMRGDTALAVDEAVKLANHYNIPLSGAEANDNLVVFQKQGMIQCEADFKAYLQRTLLLLEGIAKFPDKKVYYSAKDVPIFYHFQFKELGAFKMYVWMKSVYDIHKIDNQHYSMQTLPPELLDLGYKLWQAYSKLPALEIWNDTTLSSVIKQVEYYFEAGMLNSKAEALLICDQLKELIRRLYKQASKGTRTNDQDEELETGVQFDMYVNELLVMDNHILVEHGADSLYLVPYGGINYMHTRNPKVCDGIRSFMQQQAKKSVLISSFSEKDRNKFFIKLRYRVDQLVEKIEHANPFLT